LEFAADIRHGRSPRIQTRTRRRESLRPRERRGIRRQRHPIDVEHPDLNEIIEPGENTYVGGKDGGVFIGLKDEMLERAEAYLEERKR
jgi:hypothetical protein